MNKTHFTLNQATLLTILGAVGTAVASLVPAWGTLDQVIVAGLGAIIVAVFPLVNAQHAKAAATVAAGATALHVVSAPAEPPPDVAPLVQAEVAKVRGQLAQELAARVSAAVSPTTVPAAVIPVGTVVPPPAA